MRLLLSLVVIALPLLAVPAWADCAGDIQSAMASLAQAGPQRIVSTVQAKDGVIDIVSEKVPGAMHSRREAAGVVSEYTLLGDRAWSKEGDKWTELPAETAAGFAASLKAETSKTFDNIGDVECLGIDRHTFLQSYRLTYLEDGTRIRAAIQADPKTGQPKLLQTWSTGDEKSTAISQFIYDETITVVAPL
jgi:hypothetical protein